jgi:hypothetical protein
MVRVRFPSPAPEKQQVRGGIPGGCRLLQSGFRIASLTISHKLSCAEERCDGVTRRFQVAGAHPDVVLKGGCAAVSVTGPRSYYSDRDLAGVEQVAPHRVPGVVEQRELDAPAHGVGGIPSDYLRQRRTTLLAEAEQAEAEIAELSGRPAEPWRSCALSGRPG